MNVLVTGGAGFIGSHTVLELIEAGHDVTIVDNLSNSCIEAIKRVEQLANTSIPFFKVDLCDRPGLDRVFESSCFDSVIHFAALKAVGESVAQPLKYYENNVDGTVNLCAAMLQQNVRNLVFSSSATVYGLPKSLPMDETADTPITEITNPYGRSKLIMEFVLRDLQFAHPEMNIALLRYFNPVGAHSSGEIGEDPNGIPCNLLPYVAQVAVGKLERVSVFGGDYDTHDGTGVRDYIHVVDLAIGHLRALEKLAENPGVVVYNLGTGRGYSVLEVIRAFEKASGKTIPFEIVGRRPGDIASSYGSVEKAANELVWEAKRGIDEMCTDIWRWQSRYPDGYKTPIARQSIFKVAIRLPLPKLGEVVA